MDALCRKQHWLAILESIGANLAGLIDKDAEAGSLDKKEIDKNVKELQRWQGNFLMDSFVAERRQQSGSKRRC